MFKLHLVVLAVFSDKCPFRDGPMIEQSKWQTDEILHT